MSLVFFLSLFFVFNVPPHGYSNFLSLSWKIGDTLIISPFVTNRVDDLSTVVDDRAIIDLGSRRRGIGRCGLQADERKARRSRQAVKSRPVAQKPSVCSSRNPLPAAAYIYTRHGSTCILPGTIIISKLYNELGHSTSLIRCESPPELTSSRYRRRYSPLSPTTDD